MAAYDLDSRLHWVGWTGQVEFQACSPQRPRLDSGCCFLMFSWDGGLPAPPHLRECPPVSHPDILPSHSLLRKAPQGVPSSQSSPDSSVVTSLLPLLSDETLSYEVLILRGFTSPTSLSFTICCIHSNTNICLFDENLKLTGLPQPFCPLPQLKNSAMQSICGLLCLPTGP